MERNQAVRGREDFFVKFHELFKLVEKSIEDYNNYAWINEKTSA